MMWRLIRLLTLIALVLMPLTMAAAPTEAHAMPAMAESHCDDRHQPAMPKQMDMAQCMLMCAALPASEMLIAMPLAVPKAPRRLALDKPIHGIILETATPPPRSA